MDVALATFGFAFAALCVWLTLRIINRRERWAKWTAAILFVLLGLFVSGYGTVVIFLFTPMTYSPAIKQAQERSGYVFSITFAAFGVAAFALLFVFIRTMRRR